MIINDIEISDKELNDLFECVCAGGVGGIGDFAPQNNVTPRLYDYAKDRDNSEEDEE